LDIIIILDYKDVYFKIKWCDGCGTCRATSFPMLLTKKAKSYGLKTDVSSIFATLRPRFGISASDARVRLQGLQHDPKTSLQERAATVKRLAQITHSELLPANKER